jgi:prefoldin subunit 5
MEKEIEKLLDECYVTLEKLEREVVQLGEIRKNIEDLKEQNEQMPGLFQERFNRTVEHSEKYTNALGAATKEYLDGNNILFTEKLKELSYKINELQTEISRLGDTDFNVLFQGLQETFIEQTKEDIAESLEKLNPKLILFQTEIDELKVQIERLENIDLEKHFDSLQKTLSDIFGAINSIYSTLIHVSQSLQLAVQSLGNIQTAVNDNHKEVKQSLEGYTSSIKGHLETQDKELSAISTHVTQSFQRTVQSLGNIQTSVNDSHKEVKQSLERYTSSIEGHLGTQDIELSAIKDRINFLEIQNSELRKENRIILIIAGISAFLILTVLALVFFSQK